MNRELRAPSNQPSNAHNGVEEMLRELLAQRIPDQRWFGAGQVMKKRATAERSGTVSKTVAAISCVRSSFRRNPVVPVDDGLQLSPLPCHP